MHSPRTTRPRVGSFLCFQVHFGHYQQGSPIVPGILADSGAVAVHFRLSGLDLYGFVLGPCLLGCAGTSR